MPTTGRQGICMTSKRSRQATRREQKAFDVAVALERRVLIRRIPLPRGRFLVKTEFEAIRRVGERRYGWDHDQFLRHLGLLEEHEDSAQLSVLQT